MASALLSYGHGTMRDPKCPRYVDLYCLEFYPANLSLGDMLQRLAVISPEDLEAITVLVDHVLRRRWIALARSYMH